ncbi:MAG TPA: type II toxin-antitoxin system VapC family toxin [Chakrabartia sp.]|nr:type II toxin-antitoxin system VapC family toxin [Chakrabartia sp.]
MNFLLDTHLLLWLLSEPDKLPPSIRVAIESGEADVCASAISIAEIAIKYKRNRGEPGDMPIDGKQAQTLTEASGLSILPLEADHAAMLDTLPLHHRDPFDRMLVAQAKAEPMILWTCDAALSAYGDTVMVC